MATVKDILATVEDSSNFNEPNSTDVNHFLFENHPSKIITMIVGTVIVVADIMLFLGIIWFERFETHHSRTLMNKLFSSMCWTSVFSQVVTFCDIVRYSTGPISLNLCYVIFFLKVMFKSMLLMFLVALILTRYVMIFRLKNPASINDDFWSFFLTVWITMANFIIDFTRYFLPGKHAFAIYLCTSTDPTPDLHLPSKPTSFIEAVTILINVVLITRILIYNKLKNHENISPANQNEQNKINFLAYIEKHTIIDATTQLFVTAIFGLYVIVLIRLQTMTPHEVNTYPNNIFIYFHQMIYPGLFGLVSVVWFYLRNPPLRKRVTKEIWDRIDDYFNGIQYFDVQT